MTRPSEEVAGPVPDGSRSPGDAAASRVVWCEYAWLAGEGLREAVRVGVGPDGRVVGVVAGVPAQDGDVVLRGVAFPAAANAHSHAFHRALRGRTHDCGGTFWTWRESMYRAAGALTPELYEELATAVYAEMVTVGWTSVAEFHYVHHQPDGTPYGAGRGTGSGTGAAEPHAMELALARAAVRAGIRLTLLDTCYLAGGFGTSVTAAQRRFSDGTAARWLERLASLRATISGLYPAHQVSVGAALHSVRAVPEDQLAVIAQRLPSDLPLHVHLSEQPAENEDCLRATGRTPTGLLEHHGLVGERLSAVHATHVTAHDVGVLADAGAVVVLCPTTEADLADGIGPAGDFLDAGVRLALGTDQHAVVDPLLEMRSLEHGERLRTGRRGHFGPERLHGIVTLGGAAAQGRRSAGFAPGSAADFMAIDPGSTRTAGSARDQLAYAATAQDVTGVVVGGTLMASDGAHATLGRPGDLLDRAIARLDDAARTCTGAGSPPASGMHPERH